MEVGAVVGGGVETEVVVGDGEMDGIGVVATVHAASRTSARLRIALIPCIAQSFLLHSRFLIVF